MFSNGKTKAFSKAKRALGEEPRAETFEHNKDTDLGGGVVVGGDGRGGGGWGWFQVLLLEAPLV